MDAENQNEVVNEKIDESVEESEKTLSDAVAQEYDSRQKELEEKLKALEAEKEEAIRRAEAAEKDLQDKKAADAIANAVSDNKLLPSQVQEGSVFVEIANSNLELFERLVEALVERPFPVEGELHQDDDAIAVKKSYKDLVAEGKDPMAAFDEVQK